MIVETIEEYINPNSDIMFIVDGTDGKHIIYENGIVDMILPNGDSNQFESPGVYLIWLQDEVIEKDIELSDSQKLMIEYILKGADEVANVLNSDLGFDIQQIEEEHV